MNRSLLLIALAAALTACQSRSSVPAAPVSEVSPVSEGSPVSGQEEPVAAAQNLQQTIETEGFSSKGTIQAIMEVPVYSRIAEQIVSFDLVLGQRVRKGEVVVRLNQDVLLDKLNRNKQGVCCRRLWRPTSRFRGCGLTISMDLGCPLSNS